MCISFYHGNDPGDCTPSTLMTNFKWDLRPGNRGLPEPRYTTADYIHSLYPHTKLLVILRDPVERYSQ